MGIIDKKLLIKSKLPFYQFIVLTTLYHGEDELLQYINFPGKSIDDILLELQEFQYIKLLSDDYSDIELRKKTHNLFNKNQIDFDEFWDNFPLETPIKRRSLKPINKVFYGKFTRDYLEAKKKYLSKIKDKEEHEEIIKILQSKSQYASTEDKEFENGIIVYINQRKWEKDVKYLVTEEDSEIEKSI